MIKMTNGQKLSFFGPISLLVATFVLFILAALAQSYFGTSGTSPIETLLIFFGAIEVILIPIGLIVGIILTVKGRQKTK